MVHFHGGGFHSGNKSREARPLIGHLVSRGMVCASANYRLRPQVGYDEQLADALAAIEWVRSHAQEYGGDPDRIFLVGSSAGAYLSVDAVNAGTNGIAGIVGRYGYYGGLVAERPQPPILVIHGEHDLFVRSSNAREFVERMRVRLEPSSRVRAATRRPPRLRSLRIDPLERDQHRGRPVHHELVLAHFMSGGGEETARALAESAIQCPNSRVRQC